MVVVDDLLYRGVVRLLLKDVFSDIVVCKEKKNDMRCFIEYN